MSSASPAGEFESLSVVDDSATTAEEASCRVPAVLSIGSERETMARLRRRLWQANILKKFRTARLRLGLIVVLSCCFWIGLYVLFSKGLEFVASFGDLKSTIFNTYFSALMLMLTISSGLIMYSGLYRSEETRFLFSLPIRGESIYIHKLQEAVWFGGWGFLLTSTPMLVASGVNAGDPGHHSGAPWYYYPLMLPFLVSFMYIPASIGAMICVLVVSWLPRRRRQFMIIGVVLILAVMAWIGWTAFDIDRQVFSSGWFRDLGDKMAYTQQRFLPSYWLCAGLLEAEQNQAYAEFMIQPWSESLMYLALLVSNALMCHLVSVKIAGSRVRPSYQRLQAEVSVTNQSKAGGAKRSLDANQRSPWAFGESWFPATRQLRILILKELRIFCRDPVQYIQFVLFTGLLALYLVNLKKFPYEGEQATMIGFLNLAVVGLILSTFTTRFIYPMISLEGKRFWILNLLPVDRGMILIAKFLFAAVGSWVPCASLIFLSDWMLDVPTWMAWLHQLLMVELCFGLSGLAVGLGALMPDLREEAPSKIAAGFGGTLNLVLSALFILILVLLTAVPTQMGTLTDRGQWPTGGSSWIGWLGTEESLWIAQGINALLALAASWGTMHLGIRAFRQLGI
jgi:ABC-2 type transport system permease protein